MVLNITEVVFTVLLGSACIFLSLFKLRTVRSRLEEKEKLLGDREKEVVSLSSLQSRNSGEVDVLNTLIQSKGKQIAALKEKVYKIGIVSYNFATALRFSMFGWYFLDAKRLNH